MSLLKKAYQATGVIEGECLGTEMVSTRTDYWHVTKVRLDDNTEISIPSGAATGDSLKGQRVRATFNGVTANGEVLAQNPKRISLFNLTTLRFKACAYLGECFGL